ncbi:hypothetical protein NDN08_003720 [Rhodosorus marinus]|uniref:Fanconi anemia group M protein n=1 Tax=Rhodosorus marinus TaxID=101924 RepID=A0AAV8UYW4_9RHOD|nr:hypothetical protein NDN08_003720 [Rhodosorus marinus]
MEEDEFDLEELERIEREYLEAKGKPLAEDRSKASSSKEVEETLTASEAPNDCLREQARGGSQDSPIDDDLLEDELLLAAVDKLEESRGSIREVIRGDKQDNSARRSSGLQQSNISSYFDPKGLSSNRNKTVGTTSLEWPKEVVSDGIFMTEVAERTLLQTWVYPSNLPQRDYQFDMVKSCLVTNTMVCLPTGLGKTFVAAVVMYNYWRWFPTGKIVFVAPTKPLVRQQIQACYDITGLPSDQTIEMTGATNQKKRKALWRKRRVFFLTPQVVTNDLLRGDCPADQVVLIVLDEAHRATGNYAYCEVVSKVMAATKLRCRTLCLTATPGSNLQVIQEVINNVRCSKLEFRDEDDEDVRKYTNRKTLETITVKLTDDLLEAREDAVDILRMRVSRLTREKAMYMPTDFYNIAPFSLLAARDKWRGRALSIHPSERNRIEMVFAQCISLTYGIGILYSHGLHIFSKFLEQQTFEATEKRSRSKQELVNSPAFRNLSAKVDSLVREGKSHPKQKVCGDCIREHFHSEEAARASRVIIFVEYRESVAEIEQTLKHFEPNVRVVSFVGQSAKSALSKQERTGDHVPVAAKGMNQKLQNHVLSQFREGIFNTLISTSIGEEGLDIGEVDLIIMYDASKSPVRMVQRMGRTGRRRDGKVVILLTEGSEVAKFHSGNQGSRLIKKNLRQQKFEMYRKSARMLPPDIGEVKCNKAKLTITNIQFNQPAQKPVELARQNVDAVLERLGLGDPARMSKTRKLSVILEESARMFPASARIPSPFGFLRHSSTSGLLVSLMDKIDDVELRGTQSIENDIPSVGSCSRDRGHKYHTQLEPGPAGLNPEHSEDVFPDLTQSSSDRVVVTVTTNAGLKKHGKVEGGHAKGRKTESSETPDSLVLDPDEFVDDRKFSSSQQDSAEQDFHETNDQAMRDPQKSLHSRASSSDDLFEDSKLTPTKDVPVERATYSYPEESLSAGPHQVAQRGSDGVTVSVDNDVELLPHSSENQCGSQPDMRTRERRRRCDGMHPPAACEGSGSCQSSASRLQRRRKHGSRKTALVEFEAEASGDEEEDQEEYTTSLDGFIVRESADSQDLMGSTPRSPAAETPSKLYRRSLLTQCDQFLPRGGREGSTRGNGLLKNKVEELAQRIENQQRSHAEGTGSDDGRPRTGKKRRKLVRVLPSQSSSDNLGAENSATVAEPLATCGEVKLEWINSSERQAQEALDCQVIPVQHVTGDRAPTPAQTASAHGEAGSQAFKSMLEEKRALCRELLMDTKEHGTLNSLWRPSKSKELLRGDGDRNVAVVISSRLVNTGAVRELTGRKPNSRWIIWKLFDEDFIVGTRTCIIKRTLLDLAKSEDTVGALLASIARLRQKYENVFLVLQGPPTRFGRSPLVHRVLVSVARSRVSHGEVHIVTISGAEDVPKVIHDIAAEEGRLGEDLNWLPPKEAIERTARAVSFFEAMPRLSWPAAVSLCLSFKNVRAILNATEYDLSRNARGISGSIAKYMFKTFHRKGIRL